MDTFIEERKAVNVQANQKIDTMESSLDKRIDGLQREIDQKFDNLQKSISRLTNQQHVCPEEECLIDTILGEQAQLQQLQEESIEEPAKAFEELQDAAKSCVVYGPWMREEEILPLLTEEGSGKKVVEEPQKPILKPLALGSLPTAPSPNPMHVLPTLVAHETPTIKATPTALSVQNFRKLVAFV